jgi:hypothetical protein
VLVLSLHLLQVFIGCDAVAVGAFTVVPYSELRDDDADDTGSGADDYYYDEE